LPLFIISHKQLFFTLDFISEARQLTEKKEKRIKKIKESFILLLFITAPDL